MASFYPFSLQTLLGGAAHGLCGRRELSMRDFAGLAAPPVPSYCKLCFEFHPHPVCARAGGYEPSVRDFAGLKALARRQGGDAATNRGACRLCGGLGHLTKQCRNFLDSGTAGAAAGSGAAGAAGAAAGGDGGDNRQLLTADDDEALLLGSDDSARSSDLGSDSDSGSSGDERVSAGRRLVKVISSGWWGAVAGLTHVQLQAST
jgi:hypothetical protein